MGINSYCKLLLNQTGVDISSIDISHKLCLITGAKSGIGKATAQKLAGKGAYILMLCRDERKGEEAQKEIMRKTGNSGVELLINNLEHSYDIRKAAKTVKERFNKLDILISFWIISSSEKDSAR